MRPPLIARATIALILLMPVAGVAQDVTASALKAAFVYNFVRFTVWPVPLPASDPFVICVLGDPEVGNAVDRLVKGREVAGHRVVVSVVATSLAAETCHVAYVSAVTVNEVVQAVAGLHDSPVLIMSDVAGFTAAGGMVQLFVQRGQLRFSIKVEAVKRSGLEMSSKLLNLAQRHD